MTYKLTIKCRTVRAISSDRGKIVSGSDDHSVLVWDKQSTQLLEELKGHDAQVYQILEHFWAVLCNNNKVERYFATES